MKNISFDVIHDLKLSPNQSFDWKNKATSLYCIVAGNISHDIKTIVQTLLHLGNQYIGVFYIPGVLEFQNMPDIEERKLQLRKLINIMPTVRILDNLIPVIDGQVAIIGINGWNEEIQYAKHRKYDVEYLNNSLNKLKKQIDIRKIIVVSGAIPSIQFDSQLTDSLNKALITDTERKIEKWVFGSDKAFMQTIDNIDYITNSPSNNTTYFPLQINI